MKNDQGFRSTSHASHLNSTSHTIPCHVEGIQLSVPPLLHGFVIVEKYLGCVCLALNGSIKRLPLNRSEGGLVW